MTVTRRRSTLTAAALTVMLAVPVVAQQAVTPPADWLDDLVWRSIGPANMSGRVTDIEGLPSPSKTFYVALASGGIWKTTNNGVTFRPIFDNERVVSMGDLAIAPSDPNQIWAGTGEEDSRNSISPGGGVYKSTDGGMTWRLMGLEASEHVGRIAVHPTDPNTVFVAALGAHWRTNPERGLYKTTDGGENWRRVAFANDTAGFVDVKFHPRNPSVLFATSWQRIRGPYFMDGGGPGSALWKSTDGGETWERFSGGGLPETELGKMNVAFAPSSPGIVYMMVEAAAPEGSDENNLNGLYRSSDGGETWERTNTFNSRPFYYSEVAVDPFDPNRVYFSSFRFSDDGGHTAANAALAVHVDFHAFWIDPNDPERVIVGNDGGIGISFDRGGNYSFPNTFAVGQFYNISHDMSVPYRVCGGLQDNYSWCGPSRKADGDITNHDWFVLGGGDGFVTQQDPRDPNIIYSESQAGNMRRLNYLTGESDGFERPDWRESYRVLQDSIAMLWPDSMQPMPSQSRARIEDLQRRATADSASLQLRYNWNTPFFLSPHDPDVVYAAANRVLRSDFRGEAMYPISPDLSRQEEEKIRISTQTTGGITPDVTGAETFATIVSINESPLREGMLYAGTDDGNLWITRDGGTNWEDLTSRTTRLVPDGTYVSRIEPSQHVADRLYVTYDNHRRGDFTPYVLVTDDGGQTFRSIASDLPTGKPDFVHVIREDPVSANLLYVGTDVAAYVSLDRGTSWHRLMSGLPTVPVNDLEVHPRDGELIAGTHGRSIWIVDVKPLQQHTATVAGADAHLFRPAPAFHWGTSPTGGEFTAQAYFVAYSPEYGAEFRYWLGEEVDEGEVQIAVEDAQGNEMWSTDGPTSRGLHTVTWNQRGQQVRLDRSPSERRDSLAVERRLRVVVDSLVGAGESRDAVDEAVASLRESTGGGGRGGGGGDGLPFTRSGEFVERAGEGPPIGAGGRGGGGGGRGGAADQSLEQRITQLVRGDTGGRGRGRGGAALLPGRTEPAPLAEPGTYTVRLTVDGRELTQTFTLERTATAPTNQQ
jgi:photosystem II stability/assembly factor-like uncharacterized protein